MRNLKEASNHKLVLKKDHRVITVNENAWLKPYTDMNTDLRKPEKMIFKKIFLSWWIIQFLEKTTKKLRKRGDIKLVKAKRSRHYLKSQPNYHTTKFFTEHLLATDMKKKCKYFWINLSISDFQN